MVPTKSWTTPCWYLPLVWFPDVFLEDGGGGGGFHQASGHKIVYRATYRDARRTTDSRYSPGSLGTIVAIRVWEREVRVMCVGVVWNDVAKLINGAFP